MSIAGTTEPIECGFDINVRRGIGGTEQSRTWIGEPSAVLAKINDLLFNGALEIHASQAPNSALASVTARFGRLQDGSPEVPERNLTIQFSDTPVELHRHPHFVDISSERILALDEAAKSPDDEGESSVPANDAEWAYMLYKKRGVNTYIVKIPSVTLTRTVSASFGIGFVVADTGKIFQTGAVSNFVGASVLFAVPNANVGFASSAAGTYEVGWMQDTQVTYLANGNAQLIETYTYGIWEIAASSLFAFPLYTFG